MSENSRICHKYGIKSVKLEEFYPDFISDVSSNKVNWFEKSNIYSRVKTFLIFIAKLKYKEFHCYCCLYPSQFSSDYIVFVDIDNGSFCLILSTIRDSKQYPDSWRRVKKLSEELLLLDAPESVLNFLRQEILKTADQQHRDE